MKKGIISFGLIAAASCVFLIGTNAQDEVHVLADFTPDGFGYFEPEDCLACGHQADGWKGNTHLENAVGVKGAVDTHGEPTEDEDVEVTGVGWISSAHATSANIGDASRNYYCAYCHAPSFAKVTDDPDKAKAFRKKDLSPGMSCQACHPSHTLAGIFGTRFANYLPGTDPDLESSWKPVPKDNEGELDGKKANNQCLFCHGTPHKFNVSLHDKMLKDGTITCVKCHMPVLNTLDSGTHEYSHNMKVAANANPESCTPCHNLKKKQMDEMVGMLIGPHTDKKLNTPTF
jgi:hypothetical protein